MGYEAALEVLADPRRRAIVERLRDGAAPVGTLASGLPVSRPAVSKHLKLMLESGIVSARRDGTKRLYELDLRGLAELRSYVDGFWDDVLAGLKDGETTTEAGSEYSSDAKPRPLKSAASAPARRRGRRSTS